MPRKNRKHLIGKWSKPTSPKEWFGFLDNYLTDRIEENKERDNQNSDYSIKCAEEIEKRSGKYQDI